MKLLIKVEVDVLKIETIEQKKQTENMNLIGC